MLDKWFKHYQLNINDIDLTIASLPGVFSQKKLDTGTALLLDNLPKMMQGKVLDFGCGAGVISCFVGKKFPQTQLSLLDVSALAITSAKKTLAINNLSGHVFASNSLSTVGEKFDHIVSNPPFHQGTKTSYQATEDFLKGINTFMKNKANITLVANSFLQYMPIMKQYIGETETLINQQGFNIYYCQNK
ncbi:MAG: methyltransferase [Colwellia sp.]|nr:methyltransferase [Colwellia sp.]